MQLLQRLIVKQRRRALHVIDLLEHAAIARLQRLENARVEVVSEEPLDHSVGGHGLDGLDGRRRSARAHQRQSGRQGGQRGQRGHATNGRGAEGAASHGRCSLDRSRPVVLTDLALQATNALLKVRVHQAYAHLAAHERAQPAGHVLVALLHD